MSKTSPVPIKVAPLAQGVAAIFTFETALETLTVYSYDVREKSVVNCPPSTLMEDNQLLFVALLLSEYGSQAASSGMFL